MYEYHRYNPKLKVIILCRVLKLSGERLVSHEDIY